MPLVENSNTERIATIRRYVAVGYSETDITDADITDDGFLGASNRYIQRRISDWESLTGDSLSDAQVLVCKHCAATMLYSTARTMEIDRGSARARFMYYEMEKTAEKFMSDVESGITILTSEDSGDVEPYFCVINVGGS